MQKLRFFILLNVPQQPECRQEKESWGKTERERRRQVGKSGSIPRVTLAQGQPSASGGTRRLSRWAETTASTRLEPGFESQKALLLACLPVSMKMRPQGRDVRPYSLEVTPQKQGGWSSAGLSSPPGAELKVRHRHTYIRTRMSKILAGWGQSGGCAFHLYPPHTPQKESQSCQSSTKKKRRIFPRVQYFPG